MGRRAGGAAAGLVAMFCLLGFPALASADTTVNFDQFAAGTPITNQYANLGGTGQGVVFGPLPGDAGGGLIPVVKVPSAGQAQSDPQVADISSCFACEFPLPNTTGTFAVPRSHVSVYVGYLGPALRCNPIRPAAACAHVTLLAYDAAGNVLTQMGPTLVTTVRVHTQGRRNLPGAVRPGVDLDAGHPAAGAAAAGSEQSGGADHLREHRAWCCSGLVGGPGQARSFQDNLRARLRRPQVRTARRSSGTGCPEGLPVQQLRRAGRDAGSPILPVDTPGNLVTGLAQRVPDLEDG
jgi:hypothetical protein